MPRTHSILSAVAAAVLVPAAARPASAQAPLHARPTAPAVAGVATIVDSVIRPIANYHFVPLRGVDMPAQVTVADSAGVLVASYRLAGSRSDNPMQVDVVESDLVLQGETPSGALTLVLRQQDDPASARTSVGRWWLGDQSGELRARRAR